MKLSEEQTYNLLVTFQEYECLWNISSGNYRNRNMRKAAEEEIVSKLQIEGFGISEFKQKIKNLRTTYHQEIQKIARSKKSGSGTEDMYTPSLKWFSIMDYIVRNSKGKDIVEDSMVSLFNFCSIYKKLKAVLHYFINYYFNY